MLRAEAKEEEWRRLETARAQSKWAIHARDDSLLGERGVNIAATPGPPSHDHDKGGGGHDKGVSRATGARTFGPV